MARPRGFDTDDVLERAMELFWEEGYDGAGVQALCRVTGLNAGSIYAAFGDKRGLFLQAMRRYMQVVSQETIERLAHKQSGLLALRGYFASLIDAMLDGRRKWGCLVTNSIVEFACRDAEIAQEFRLHLARLEAALGGAVERARQAGELPATVSSLRGAQFLMTIVQGMNVLAKVQPGRAVLEGVAATAIQALKSPADDSAPRAGPS